MATTKYLLIVNNTILRTDDKYPIFEEKLPNGDSVYFSRRSQHKAQEKVEDFMNQLKVVESKDPMYKVIQNDVPVIKHIDSLRIKLVYTQLYIMKTKFAYDDSKTIVAGTGIDLAPEWDKMRYSFYTDEFLKYSQIVDYLEGVVRTKRPKLSPFTIVSSGNRVMNIVHLNVPGLFNPLMTVKGLEDTKFFKSINTAERDNPIVLKEPAIFPLKIIQGTVMAYFATSSDVMAMCNIDYHEPITSRNLYRLVAGIVIRLMFPETEATTSISALNLPINKTFYRTVDVNTGVPNKYYKTYNEALQATQADLTLQAQEINTDQLFILSAFPSFKNKNVTSETELVHLIGGADFV